MRFARPPAYRQNSEQLVQLDDRLGRGTAQVERTPYEEVRDFFHFVDNYVAEIDLLAEELAYELEIEGGETYGILAAHLRSRFGVHITRTEAAGGLIRHFDPAGKTLALSSYMAAPTRCFQLALQIAQLHAGATVDRVLAGAGFRSAEAAEICRIGLHNYFAAALILPYGQFHRAAQELRHDLELLAVRFGASLEQVAHRLSTLQRPVRKACRSFSPRSTGLATSPNATAPQGCNLPARRGLSALEHSSGLRKLRQDSTPAGGNT